MFLIALFCLLIMLFCIRMKKESPGASLAFTGGKICRKKILTLLAKVSSGINKANYFWNLHSACCLTEKYLPPKVRLSLQGSSEGWEVGLTVTLVQAADLTDMKVERVLVGLGNNA